MTNTFRNLKAGQDLTCGYRGHSWDCTFLGFSDAIDKHSDDVAFSCWKDLAAAKGFKNFKDLDDAVKPNDYGVTHYAVFRDTNGMVWSAYRFNGYWAVGSSADRLRLND